MVAVVLGSAGGAPIFNWSSYRPPRWQDYRAPALPAMPPAPTGSFRGSPARAVIVTFGDLKTESDASLARRLLGKVGARIAFIDRHRERWYLFKKPEEAAERLDLFTHPAPQGSSFGICGVEHTTIEFDEAGRIETVESRNRFGVEGPLFQKSDFDWDGYRRTCARAAPGHAPRYFPAPDSLVAQDVARLAIVVFERNASSAPLPFTQRCWAANDRPCVSSVRGYLGSLRLDRINEYSEINCRLGNKPPGSICFTIKVDEGRRGPFPKYITVTGSTYLHRLRIDSVEVFEYFTMR